jgi:hypothetical protein
MIGGDISTGAPGFVSGDSDDSQRGMRVRPQHRLFERGQSLAEHI